MINNQIKLNGGQINTNMDKVLKQLKQLVEEEKAKYKRTEEWHKKQTFALKDAVDALFDYEQKLKEDY